MRRLPITRESIKVALRIYSADAERRACAQCGAVEESQRGKATCYLTVGLHDDGTPGELFTRFDKAGSSEAGLLDAWAIAISMLLREGVPLETLVAKFRGHRFEPSGLTGERGQGAIRVVSSPIDYVMRYLERRFLAPCEAVPEPIDDDDEGVD